MKKYFLILFLVLWGINSFGQNCYRLIWSDEFDKDGAPNSANWGYDLGNSGYGNNEIQNYTSLSENARVENGILIIEAKKSGNAWTSARLKSQGKQSFTYGRIEFRAKLPKGSGTWPALWMLGESIASAGWPACGEIDVMEHVGKNPGVVQAALHTPSSNGNTYNKMSTTVSDFSTAFHTYAVEWSETKMDFYVDNLLYYTYAPSTRNDQTWPFYKPQFLIMNIAMGGNWGSDTQYETGGLKNGIDPSLTSVRMEVDYVRYYNKTDVAKISGSTQLKEGEDASFSILPTADATYNWSVPAGATIKSGQNTNKINVTWGASSGNVSLNMELACGPLSIAPLAVLLKIKPSTDVYQVYNALESFDIQWHEVQTVGNTITLSQIPELQINYNITNPIVYPTIKYSFGSLADLSNYGFISLTLKTDETNPPSVIRLDVYDINGNYNYSNIFKVDNFINDGQYHTYSASIASVFPFNLTSVTELRFYINYIANAKTGQGVCWLKDVTFSRSSPLYINNFKMGNSKFSIYPNPAKNILNISPLNEISDIRIFSNSGVQLIYSSKAGNLNIEDLSPGYYNVMIKDIESKLYNLQFLKL